MPGQDPPPDLSADLDRAGALQVLDPVWYDKRFPDVALSGLTPEEHYRRIGLALGRPGSPAALAALRAGGAPAQPLAQPGSGPPNGTGADPAVLSDDELRHPLLARRAGPPPPAFAPTLRETLSAIIPAPPDLAHRADPPLSSRPAGPPPRPVIPGTTAFHWGGHTVACALEQTALAAPLALLDALAGAGPAPAGPVTLAAGPALVAGRFPLSDGWFATAQTLRLSFAEPVFHSTDPAAPGTPGAGPVLRAWQLRPAGGAAPALVEVGGGPLPLQGPGFCDLTLDSPVMPLLLDLADPQGLTLAFALLPFPSLMRGGLHGAELVAAGLPAPQGLWRLLAGLLAEYLARLPGQDASQTLSPRALGTLLVASQGAVGIEPVFAPEVTDWLAALFGLVPRLTGHDPADPGQAWLAQSLGQSEALIRTPATGPLTLTIPPDSLPTLGALVSRRLGAAARSVSTSGPWLLADAATRDALWSVALPARGDGVLAGLQPRNGALSFPRLDGPCAADSQPPPPVPLHLTIAYRFRTPRNEAQMLMPCAPDAPGGVLHAIPDRGAPLPPLTVALAITDLARPAALDASLDSIARQEGLGLVQMILCLPADTPPAVRALLAARTASRLGLPGAALVLLLPPGPPDLGLIAARALHEAILILSDQTVLHDPRTLSTLAAMLAADSAIASAACLLLREVQVRRGTALVPVLEPGPAGVFPAQLSFLGAPHLVVTEPDCLAILPNATYPVLANGLDLMLVARAAIRATSATIAPAVHGTSAIDLRFGLAALEAGWTHLCTTAITATSLRPALPPRDEMDPMGAAWRPGPCLSDILARVTTLARVV